MQTEGGVNMSIDRVNTQMRVLARRLPEAFPPVETGLLILMVVLALV
jgi:hypothetical protein